MILVTPDDVTVQTFLALAQLKSTEHPDRLSNQCIWHAAQLDWQAWQP